MDIIQAYQSGKTLRAIAAEVGVSHMAVKKRLLDAGVVLRLRREESNGVKAWLPKVRKLRIGGHLYVEGTPERTIYGQLAKLAPKRFSVISEGEGKIIFRKA